MLGSDLLRFYKDGLVISAAVSGNMTRGILWFVLRWFHRNTDDLSRAEYRVDGDTVEFSEGECMYYSGRVLEDGTLDLGVFNLEKGSSSRERYVFWEDRLPPGDQAEA